MAVAAHSRSGDNIGEPMRLKLTAFAHTLRGNGFKIGLAETADALSILVMSPADKPATLKPALRTLFCATRSDWERFDEIFDAFWLARGIRQARVLAGAAPEGAAPVRALKDVGPRGGKPGLPDHVERRRTMAAIPSTVAVSARMPRAPRISLASICATSLIPRKSGTRTRWPSGWRA